MVHKATRETGTRQGRGVPSYLFAGGPGSDHKATQRMLGEVVASVGRSPLVAYLGSASGDSERFLGWISEMLCGAGARKVEMARTVSDTADHVATRALLTSCDIVFVSGGDVEAGIDVLKRRRLTGFLGDLASSGKVFCGVSAGSIMMAREWVRWPDPDNDDAAERFGCLDIAPVLCDAHGEADDWAELQALLLLCPDNTRGYGIRTEAALRVTGERVEILGGAVDVYRRAGHAVVLDEVLT